MYWAHCRECGDHFETKSGECPGCRVAESMSVDAGAEAGCADCREIDATEQRLASARRVLAAKWTGAK
jgi:hypothetical protein